MIVADNRAKIDAATAIQTLDFRPQTPDYFTRQVNKRPWVNHCVKALHSIFTSSLMSEVYSLLSSESRTQSGDPCL